MWKVSESGDDFIFETCKLKIKSRFMGKVSESGDDSIFATHKLKKGDLLV